MDAADRISYLKALDLFTDAPEALLAKIARQLMVVDLPAGATVFEEGQQGDGVYFVVGGRLRLTSGGVTLIHRGPGECVGEFSLVDEGPRSAAALAVTGARLLKWLRRDFEAALCQDGAVALGILRVLAGKLREDVSAQARAFSELETARRLQMGLMPRSLPETAAVEVAGRCVPASQASGDFFQYHLRDGRLLLCIADVTGHAMQAAIPAVMFSGMLSAQLDRYESLEGLFGDLNRQAHQRFEYRTYVCFTAAEIDIESRVVRICNSGCPYPCLYGSRTGETVEVRLDAYPLGVRPDAGHRAVQVPLDTGDVVVLCSDGVSESVTGEGDVLGPDGARRTITAACRTATSTQRVVEGIFTRLGGQPPVDDQTVVAARMLD